MEDTAKRGYCNLCEQFGKRGVWLDLSGSAGLTKSRERWERDTRFTGDIGLLWRRQDLFVEMRTLREEVVLEKYVETVGQIVFASVILICDVVVVVCVGVGDCGGNRKGA